MADGHYFLHAHPRLATSWQLRVMAGLMEHPDVHLTHGDQCQYGAEVQSGNEQGAPLLKPTGFLSNSIKVVGGLSRVCTGAGGRCSRAGGAFHASCTGHKAKDAAKYPRGLCRAMIRGITAQLRADNLLKNGCYGIQAPDDDEQVILDMHSPEQGYSGKYRDDLSGQVLMDKLVEGARAK